MEFLSRSAGPARRLLLLLALALLVTAAIAQIEDFDESDNKEDRHRGGHRDKDDHDDHKRDHKDDDHDKDDRKHGHHDKDDHKRDHHDKDDHKRDHHDKDDHKRDHHDKDDHKRDHHDKDDHKHGHHDKDEHKGDHKGDHAKNGDHGEAGHEGEEQKDHDVNEEYDELDARLDQITYRLNKIDEELDVRLDPGNRIKGLVLEHRVELLEEDVCDHDHFYCGRADPECVSRLFVCDGIQDCRDGEDEHHCDLPLSAGDTFVGHTVWDNCTSTTPDTISFSITGVKTSPASPGFPQIRLTFELTHESDNADSDISVPTVGFYRFATQNLVVLSPSEEGLGLICDFDGHDPDRCVGRTMRVANLEQCAEYIFFRETEDEEDDDGDHHHERH